MNAEPTSTKLGEVEAALGAAARDTRRWEGVERWVTWYGWLTLAAVAFGIGVAHKALFTGLSWSTCGGLGCVLTFHLIDVPFAGFLAFVAIYGLMALTRATARRYQLLVGTAIVVELAWLGFEVVLLLMGFERPAPTAEQAALAAVAALLLLGAGLGVYLRDRIQTYLHPIEDPRFVHPSTEKQLVGLVRRAKLMHAQIRVRGSEHSCPSAIYADGRYGCINVQLDRYNRIVNWDDARRRVTVQAGCHLGIDPRNPRSTKKNSLLWQLEKRGWALPDLGGITHQTVSGFISTGSMGGSTKHDVGDAIVGIRLIDGNGNVHELAPNPDDPDDAETNPFYAAGVSMGLLGVISTVTFQCLPRYDVVGDQITTRTDDSFVDLFADTDKGLAARFRQVEYTRLLWWPQRGVNKLQVWEAHRATEEERRKVRPGGELDPKQFVSVEGGRFSQAFVIRPFYHAIAYDKPPFEPGIEQLVQQTLNLFLQDGTQKFWDRWLVALPMDDQISDEYMPTEFTELFFDLEDTPRVMNALKEYFQDDDGMAKTGPYAWEIYPSRASKFWLSPSYGKDCLRVDIFCFHTGRGRPEVDFYPQHWKLFKDKGLHFRAHWGKHLPPGHDPDLGAEYLRSRYPKWDAFMKLREEMDPDGVFLTDYWRQHLGLYAASTRQKS